MKKAEKDALVTGLGERLKGVTALYYTDFTGLNVKNMTELRRRCRKAGVEYFVIKNTLAQRAISDVGLPVARLQGPTGVVIGKDPIATARLLADFAREFEQRPQVKGGILDGRQLDVAQVRKLATLPSRNEMLSQLAAGMQSPLAAFAGALNGLLFMFAGALDALKTQRENG
jgi:large subunit ribosomal protein L10